MIGHFGFRRKDCDVKSKQQNVIYKGSLGLWHNLLVFFLTNTWKLPKPKWKLLAFVNLSEKKYDKMVDIKNFILTFINHVYNYYYLRLVRISSWNTHNQKYSKVWEVCLHDLTGSFHHPREHSMLYLYFQILLLLYISFDIQCLSVRFSACLK